MPIEIRRLIYSDDEICEIITRYLSGAAGSTEPGTAMGIERRSKEPMAVACRIQRRSGRQTVDLFNDVMLCEALISWCMDNGIPLARKAFKAVRLAQDGRVAFDITISPAPPPD